MSGKSSLHFTSPCESNLVKWIPLLIRPSRTDRWLPVRLNSYLSSRCLIARDYTLLQKRVKQNDLYIIGISMLNGENRCYPKCATIKNLHQEMCECLSKGHRMVLRVSYWSFKRLLGIAV